MLNAIAIGVMGTVPTIEICIEATFTLVARRSPTWAFRTLHGALPEGLRNATIPNMVSYEFLYNV